MLKSAALCISIDIISRKIFSSLFRVINGPQFVERPEYQANLTLVPDTRRTISNLTGVNKLTRGQLNMESLLITGLSSIIH